MELVGHVATGLATLFGRVDPDGLEHLPSRGPAIVAVNHTTIADVPPVLSTLFHAGMRPSEPCGRPDCGRRHTHIRFLASSHVFRNPLIGPLARQAGMIEVGFRQAGVVALQAAREALGRGEIVGIYPEGDVSAAPDGAPRRFRLGVGRLAADTRAPVVPIAHHDAREIGSGSLSRSLGGALTSIVRRPTVRLRVGRPVVPEEFAGLPIRDVVALVHERVTDVWRTIAGDARGGAAGSLGEKTL